MLPLVYVDAQQIDLVLGNLVANALRMMPQGGTLVVDAEALDDMVVLSVVASGCGIPPDRLDDLSSPGPPSVDLRAGIGLAISRGLLEANEGVIRVESQAVKGSIFRVFLPTKSRAL